MLGCNVTYLGAADFIKHVPKGQTWEETRQDSRDRPLFPYKSMYCTCINSLIIKKNSSTLLPHVYHVYRDRGHEWFIRSSVPSLCLWREEGAGEGVLSFYRTTKFFTYVKHVNAYKAKNREKPIENQCSGRSSVRSFQSIDGWYRLTGLSGFDPDGPDMGSLV